MRAARCWYPAAVRYSPGEQVEVSGFLTDSASGPGLNYAVFRRVSSGPPPIARRIHARDVAAQGLDARLVELRAVLAASAYSGEKTLLTFRDDGVLFGVEAPLNDREARVTLAPGSQWLVRGLVRQAPSGLTRAATFRLQLASERDLTLLRAASWWTPARLFLIAGISLGAVSLCGSWIIALRRRVRRQTEEIRLRLEPGSGTRNALSRTIREHSRHGPIHGPGRPSGRHQRRGSDQEQCYAAGMDDFVSKPVSLATLEAVLRRFQPSLKSSPDLTMSRH